MTDSDAMAPSGAWRDHAWVAIVLLLFVPVQLAALILADRLGTANGIGFPERERVASVATALGGLAMLPLIPSTARILGGRIRPWAGLSFALFSVPLAALASYAVFDDVRSGGVFETDHAMPELMIPYGVLVMMTGAIGNRLAVERPVRQTWAWVVRVAAAVSIVLVGLAAVKMMTAGGDFALDLQSTAVVLFCVGAYAVITLRSLR